MVKTFIILAAIFLVLYNLVQKHTTKKSYRIKLPGNDEAIYSKMSKYRYNEFLKEYLKRGGKITHHYNYTFNHANDRRQFLIMKEDGKLPKMYGASSKTILVPENVVADWDTIKRVVIGSHDEMIDAMEGNTQNLKTQTDLDVGHNKILFEGTYHVVGRWIPAYKDTVGYDESKA